MPIRLEIVTIERQLYSEDVDMVVAPGVEGEMGILPHHTPVLTSLKEGVLRVKRGGEEELFAIGGGIMQVLPDKVIVLADAAEYSDEIDLARAEEARQRAEKSLQAGARDMDLQTALASLRRSQIRIKVAQQRRRRRGGVELQAE
jgi:F-type H+-transporting ATPase subunit epsilon